MNIKFKQKKIFISISVVVIILLTIGYIVNIGEAINRFKCGKRGGFWGGTGMCYPIKDLALKKENVTGLKINIPEKENWFAILSNGNQESLSGFIENLKTGKKTGEVIFYIDKMKNISGEFEFIAPFNVIYESGDKYSYLGLFSFSKEKREKGYHFYKNVEHLDSYLVDQDIVWGENSVSESEWHDGLGYGASFNFVKQEYFKGDEKKEIVIDVYRNAPYFSLHKTCDEIGYVVTKNRGDGKGYSVCVWKNGNQCDLNRYERRMCPRGGFDVSGLDSEAEIYAVINSAVFYEDNTFYVSPEHNHCVVDDYFNGKCD